VGDLLSFVPNEAAYLGHDVEKLLKNIFKLFDSFFVKVLNLVQRLFIVSFGKG